MLGGPEKQFTVLKRGRKSMDQMKVVILCGGKGTRSYPFTEYFPKVMMPINGTPILVHLMRVYAAQGFGDFILAGGHRKEMLTDYFVGFISFHSFRTFISGHYNSIWI